MTAWHGGKGSKQRPAAISRELAGLKHDLIFKKCSEKEKEAIKRKIKEIEVKS